MKKAIITGASGGIGLATTRLLANREYELTLVSRNEEKLKSIVQELPGNNHQFITADLSNDDGIENIANHLSTNSYDLLINNAGIGIYGAFIEIDLEKQKSMLKLNIDAVLILSFAFLKDAKSGDALINIGSILGSTSYSGASAYAGTKGFVVRFTESLWDEYRKKGIFVCVLSPGVTSSNFHKAAGGEVSDFPEIIHQTPTQVAEVIAKALAKRKQPHVVSGFMNQSMLYAFRFLSRKSIVKLMGSFVEE